ncbi:hypothetical protein ACWEOG_16600 [Amycolatopsis japonica]
MFNRDLAVDEEKTALVYDAFTACALMDCLNDLSLRDGLLGHRGHPNRHRSSGSTGIAERKPGGVRAAEQRFGRCGSPVVGTVLIKLDDAGQFLSDAASTACVA